MKDVVVEEIAWQMGRPTRYGGEFGGVNVRTDYMAGIAAKTLAPEMIEDSDKFRRYLAREALGVVFIVEYLVRAWICVEAHAYRDGWRGRSRRVDRFRRRPSRSVSSSPVAGALRSRGLRLVVIGGRSGRIGAH